MPKDNLVFLDNVWLKYKIDFKDKGKVAHEDFWALKGIDLAVKKGETFGIIGENGAGKTTLLKVIAGMLKPDKGVIEVTGRVSTLLEIGAGFQKDLTGSENIYLISSLFGLTKAEIQGRYEKIVKFASIGRFINAPVKCYSQGMYMRLAFAIAIHIDPDILLIDDIFVVGDTYTQRRCMDKMFELKDQGKTIIFVSHDLEAVKRFCQRGILLRDGKIIKDGQLKEVVGYYFKTIGDKKGIGILAGGNLGAVFNNGRLVINWNEDSLTKEWGGYISVTINGNSYSSIQADWQLRESAPERIVLEGRFWDLPIVQVCSVGLNKELNEIDFRVELEILKDCNIQECILGFMFRDDYKQWFDSFHKELFKVVDFDNELGWTKVSNDKMSTSLVGLNNPEGDLPAVILEDEVVLPSKILQVKNTDRIFKARVLESRVISAQEGFSLDRLGSNLVFHAKVKILDTPEKLDAYLKNASRNMLPKVISNGDLILAADTNHKIDISWKGKKITASQGFQTSFWYKGKVYYSSDGLLKIYKAEVNRLEFVIEWKDLPIKQVWLIELQRDGLVRWQVFVDVLEKTQIINSAFNIMLLPEYREWVNNIAKGLIAEELSATDHKDIIMKNDPYGMIGLNSIKLNGFELPQLLIHDQSDILKFNSIDKSVDKNVSFSDGLHKIEPVSNVLFLAQSTRETIDFPKGRHLMYDAKIFIGTKEKEDSYKKEIIKSSLSEPAIGQSGYSFNFLRGQGRLFLKGSEITKNLGIYTSLYSKDFHINGRWYVSLEALWEIVSFKRERMVLRGNWPYLPLTQIWQIKAEKNSFIWNVDMEVYAPVNIEKEQAFLMLSDKYQNWGAFSKQRFSFPQSFSLSQWESLYRNKETSKLYVDGDGGILPNLSFALSGREDGFEAIVENANNMYSSRVIGFQKELAQDKQTITSGLYKYFQGIIEF